MGKSFQANSRDWHHSQTDTKGRLFVVDVSVNWPSDKELADQRF